MTMDVPLAQPTVIHIVIALLAAAIQLAANPWALIGYIGLGVYSQGIWQAIKYGLLWGLALQLFALASGRENILDGETLAVTTALRLTGAVILTLAAFTIARLLRRRNRGRGKAGWPGRR